MIRIIICSLFLILFAIVSIPLYVVTWIIGRFSQRKQRSFAQHVVGWAFHVILFFSGAKVLLKGKEHIPDAPVLFVSNHRSYFDIVIAYASVPHLTGFVAKKEIQRIPCLRTWMKFLHCEFLDRKDMRSGLKTILACIEEVKAGYSVHIAPEGHRTPGDEMLPFKEGSFKIAQKTGCPIVPIAISNTEALFESHVPLVRSAKVVFEYGAPIYLNTLDPEIQKHPSAYVQQIIGEMLAKNKSLIP